MDIMNEVKALDRSTLELEYMHTLLGKLNSESALGKAQKRISTLERKVRKLVAELAAKATPSTPEGIRYVESQPVSDAEDLCNALDAKLTADIARNNLAIGTD